MENEHIQKTDEVAEALALAQSEMEACQMTGYNAHRKYHYAKLGDIIEATKEPLAKHGLSVSQTFAYEDQRTFLETTLLHKSGQSLTSRLALLPCADYHALGSAITYSRKYALAAMLNIVGEEDDDGEMAMATAGAKSRPTRKPSNFQVGMALAVIDQVDGAKQMLEAKDIDIKDMPEKIAREIVKKGPKGMAEAVLKFRSEVEK